VKISNKKISFFPSQNQNFPHIPYVASKKCVNSKLSKQYSGEQSLPSWVRKLSHPRGEIAQRQLFRISQFAQKLSVKKKMKK
jgi:hypothetical protein